MELAAALHRVGVPVDLHIYERGAHGMGLGSRSYDPAKFHPWTRDCEFWLRLAELEHNFIIAIRRIEMLTAKK